MFPFTRFPFWVPIFDPPPYIYIYIYRGQAKGPSHAGPVLNASGRQVCLSFEASGHVLEVSGALVRGGASARSRGWIGIPQQIGTHGGGSKVNRRGKPQVLVHVSTYQVFLVPVFVWVKLRPTRPQVCKKKHLYGSSLDHQTTGLNIKSICVGQTQTTRPQV